MAYELTEFEASDLERILRDMRTAVLSSDWQRLEAKADDLKVWCKVVRKKQGG